MNTQYGTNENETMIVEIDMDTNSFNTLDEGEILEVETDDEFENWESGEYTACKFKGEFYMKYAFEGFDLQTYKLSELNEYLKDLEN